jgi:hypothetical protein
MLFVIDNFMNNLEYALYCFEAINKTEEAIDMMINNVRLACVSVESDEEFSEEWDDREAMEDKSGESDKSNEDSYCVLM